MTYEMTFHLTDHKNKQIHSVEKMRDKLSFAKTEITGWRYEILSCGLSNEDNNGPKAYEFAS